jgi:NADH-quinone oxidoreductase subunit J
MLYLLRDGTWHQAGHTLVDAKQVGISLFGPYLLVVELASLLLLAALVAAYHLGKRDDQ